jgi:hypothetical protein
MPNACRGPSALKIPTRETPRAHIWHQQGDIPQKNTRKDPKIKKKPKAIQVCVFSTQINIITIEKSNQGQVITNCLFISLGHVCEIHLRVSRARRRFFLFIWHMVLREVKRGL